MIRIIATLVKSKVLFVKRIFRVYFGTDFFLGAGFPYIV